MIGFLTSIPSAILFSVAQQILCKKETGDTTPSPGNHFSFDSLLSSLFKASKAVVPSQKAPLNAVTLSHTGNPESLLCNKDSAGKDAQAAPTLYKDMSLYPGLHNLQALSFSLLGFSDISVGRFYKSLFAKEGKGEISYIKTDTALSSQLLDNLGCFSTPCISSLRVLLNPSSAPVDETIAGMSNTAHLLKDWFMIPDEQIDGRGKYSHPSVRKDLNTAIPCGGDDKKSPYIFDMPSAAEHTLQTFTAIERNNGNPQNASTKFIHAAADMNPSPADRIGVMGTELKYSAPLAETNAGMRNTAHLLQEWFTISDEQIDGRGGGIVSGAFMRQGHGETKENANPSSLHNLHDSFHDNIPSARIVSNESLQREGTHEVLSLSPGVNRDVTGLTHEKIHLIRSANTIMIHIEPEGLGKLDIHLNLEKGMLHTLINASHDTVRDFLREQSWHIMNTLMQDGLNVGSFSVSLKGGGMGWESQMSQERAFSKPSEEKESEPVHDTSRGLISIFV